MNIKRALGWRKPTAKLLGACQLAGPPTHRSVLADWTAAETSNLYESCSVLDQGSVGSCQSNAVAQAVRVAQVKEGVPHPPPAARMAMYYWARHREGNEQADVGACIGTVFDVIAALGVPPESAWPYDVNLLTSLPGPDVYREAFDSRGKVGINYYPLQLTGDAFVVEVERALTAGFAVPFGVMVTDMFCIAQPSGAIQPPRAGDSIAGGHAMTFVGHDRSAGRFLVLNSWGTLWGDPDAPPGCCWFSYAYASQAADAWIVLVAPKTEVE